ncbi:MAG: hypothetical protein RhofKO_04160 [Rhodothermales bacterium]
MLSTRFPLLLAVVLIGGFTCTIPVFAQVTVYDRTPDGDTHIRHVPRDGSLLEVGPSDARSSTIYAPHDRISVIVEFTTPPRASGGALKATLSGERAALQDMLDRLAGQHAAKSGESSAVITHDYRLALNGMALRIPRWMRSHVEALPGVKRVFTSPLAEPMAPAVQMSSAVSIAANDIHRRIGVDRVHEVMGLTGEGVTIGIMSTGLDYTHPGLGGGIGPEYKVIGGANFAPDSTARTDIADLDGDGTQLAGLVAGTGEGYTGVAPQANLLAIRVGGRGYSVTEAAFLAGLEYALNPDGDPTTDDAVDVLLFGIQVLQRYGEVMEDAINRAVAAGVVCVGMSRSAALPGGARDAIAVGSTRFINSYEGPTSRGFINKPDLLAPSADGTVDVPTPILLGGPYAEYDLFSTQASAAYAAGAVALLLQHTPDLSPAEVRARLTQHAVDLGEPLWKQGGGRLDVWAALQASATLAPSTLSFGLLPTNQPVVTLTDTLTLTAVEASSYTLAVEGLPPNGLAATLTPSELSLAAGEAQEVMVQFTASPDELPYLNPPPEGGYTGHIVAYGTADTLRVPFSLIHSHHLEVQFDRTPDAVTLVSASEVIYSPPLTTAAFSQLLDAGDYTLFAFFHELLPNGTTRHDVIAVEDFRVSGAVRVEARDDRLIHTIDFDMRDINGQPMPVDHVEVLAWREEAGFVITDTRPAGLRTSALSDRFALEVVAHTISHPSGDDYSLAFTLNAGVQGSRTLQNDPRALRAVDLTFGVPDSMHQTLSLLGLIRAQTGLSGYASFFARYLYDEALIEAYQLEPPFTQRLFMNAKPESHRYRFDGYALVDPERAPLEDLNNLSDGLLRLSGFYWNQTNVLTLYHSFSAHKPLFQTTRSVLQSQTDLPPIFTGDARRLIRDVYGLFSSPYGDFRPSFPDRTITQGRETYPSYYFNGLWSGHTNLGAADRSAPYTVHMVDGAFETDGVPGRSEVDLHTSASDADIYPPILGRLHTLSAGQPSAVLLPRERPEVLFEIWDYVRPSTQPVYTAVDEASLAYRRHGDVTWTPLGTVREGDFFRATWPTGLPETYYDLRVSAADEHGNAITQRLMPAFRFGYRSAEGNTPPTMPQLVTPPDTLRAGAEQPFTFAWTPAMDPDDDPVSTRFRMTGAGENLILPTTTDSTLHIDLSQQVHPDETYRWWVEASDGFSIVASDTATVYIAPTNVAEEEQAELPVEVALTSSYPNPFSHSTTLRFTLPEALPIRLEVFDTLGRRLATLADGWQPAGTHTLDWNAGDAPSGVYFARLQAGGQVHTLRMVRSR